MAFTYSGDPSSSPADAVRFELGDTDPSRPLLSDAEVSYLLNATGQSVLAAALQGCGNILAKLARSVDETTGPISRAFSQRFKNLSEIRDALEMRLGMAGGNAGYVGGISRWDEYVNCSDPDWARGSFSDRMMENPRLDDRTASEFSPFVSLSDQD